MDGGRAVLVTGGSRGIGAAVARAFAEAGDRVAVHHGRNAEKARAVAAALPGDGHAVVGADLADPDAVRVMVDEAAERLGGLDVLVNNAGIFAPHPITETTYEEWQQGWRDTLGVNLVGAANVTWCAVRHMLRARRRADRQRVLARRVPRRAGPARLRREQGRADRLRPVARARPRPARDHGRRGRARLHRDRHGGRGARGRARRRAPRREPARPRRDARGDRGRGPVPRLARPPTMATGAVLDVNGASYLRM